MRLVGNSAGSSHVKKLTADPMISMSGPATDTTGDTHCKYFSIENLYLDGNKLAGAVIHAYYADNLYFRDAWIKDNYDVCIDTAEFWDSRFYNLVIETSGSLSDGTATPNVLLSNSASATVGVFGYSTDNVDPTHFVGCRFEDFRQGAIWIGQGPALSNNPNGIFLTNCKMDSSYPRGGPRLSVDDTCRGIYVDRLYCFLGGLGDTTTEPQNVIVWAPNAASTLDERGTRPLRRNVQVHRDSDLPRHGDGDGGRGVAHRRQHGDGRRDDLCLHTDYSHHRLHHLEHDSRGRCHAERDGRQHQSAGRLLGEDQVVR